MPVPLSEGRTRALRALIDKHRAHRRLRTRWNVLQAGAPIPSAAGMHMLAQEKEYTMALNVPLLRGSLDLVVERQPEFTQRFYDILFTRYPQVRPLFGRNSGGAQARMLQEAIVAVMDRIEDAGWVASTLGALGARHVDYGVTEEMYGWVGECLLATLAEIAGPDWTPELATAWAEAYGAISGMMLAGAAQGQSSASAESSVQ